MLLVNEDDEVNIWLDMEIMIYLGISIETLLLDTKKLLNKRRKNHLL